MNDPQPPRRSRHPLEQRPPEPSENPEGQESGQRVIFNLPTRQPIVTYVLCAVNIIIFVLGLLSPSLENSLFQFGMNRPREVLLGGDYYRLFTSMFLHGGIAHIFFNAYALYSIGSSLERLFGHARFAVIYLLGGIAGSILSTIMGDLSVNVGSVGASGAVFAIFGAEMVYLYGHRAILGRWGRAQLQNLIVLLGINFLIGIASSAPGAAVRIDNWAHLGGLLGGLALTWLIGPRFGGRFVGETFVLEDTAPFDGKYWAVSLYVIILVVILAAVTLVVRS